MGNDQITRSELEALEGAYLLTEACAAREIEDEDRAVALSWAQSEIARRVKRYMRERAEQPRGHPRPATSDGVVLAAMRLNAAWLSGDIDSLRSRGRELRARMDELEDADFTRAAAARAGAVLRLTEVTGRSPDGMMGWPGLGGRAGEEPRVVDASEVRVVRDEEAERYHLLLGVSSVGKSEYRLSPGTIVFTHTEISPEYEGHGLGQILVRSMLDEARADGLTVLPLCPFVAAYIRRHPEYQDLTPG